MIGQSVGNFRITKLIGGGGMGTVYLAEHPELGRRAAVKVLHPELAGDAEIVQRFFNEARAANAVGHRGIVEALDFGRLASGAPYIVMELLSGESLAGRLRRVGRLPTEAAIAVADQMAAALGAAHAKGIVHRDLKPDNVFLVDDPEHADRASVKILDFGVAKLQGPVAGGRDLRTRTGVVMGTPQYMSPEQCRDAREVDQRADIYSLGVVLHEMLAGAPPFSSSSWAELVHMHIGVAPPALRACGVELAAPLEAIVLRTLAKDPGARFASMEELRQALSAAWADVKVGASVAPAPSPTAGGAPARTLVMPATAVLDSPPRQSRSTTLSGTASELDRGTRQRRARTGWAGVAVLGAALVAGAAVLIPVVRGGGRRPAQDARPVVAAPTAPPPPARASIPETIVVEIETEPDGARVVRARDHAPLGTTPIKLTWARGEGAEPLDVEHDGYRSERVAVPLERGLTAKLHLEKVVRARRPAGGTGHAKSAPRTPPKVRPEPLKI